MTPRSDLAQRKMCESAHDTRRAEQIEAPTSSEEFWPDQRSGGSAFPQETGSFDFLTDLTNIIRFRPKLIGLVTFASALFFCIYAYSLDNVFESSAEMDLLHQTSLPGAVDSHQERSQGTSYITSQMRLLGSFRLIEGYADTLHPSEISEILGTRQGFSSVRAGFLHGVSALALRSLRLFDASGFIQKKGDSDPSENIKSGEKQTDPVSKTNAARCIHKALRVQVPRGLARESGIIAVSMRALRPHTAQQMLTKFLEFYNSTVREQMNAELATRRNALHKWYAVAEQKLLKSEQSLAEFTRRHGIVPGADDAAAPFGKLLEKAIERVVEIREEKERIRSQHHPDSTLRTASLGKTDDNDMLTSLNQQLARLEMQYAEWKSVYSASFPKMVQLQEKIDFLRKKVDLITKKAAASALESATREEELRERTSAEMRKDAQRMQAVQNQCMVLKKNVEADTRMCQKILSALWELDIRVASAPTGIAVIEPPTMPSIPVAPRRWLIIVIGIALGLVSGVGSAAVMEATLRNTRVLDIEKIASDINARPLGIVPDFNLLNRAGRVRQPAGDQLCPAFGSDSPIGHIIRDIETSLFFLQPSDQSKYLLVASAISREGKTFMAASLAWAISAREGQRTLVIDADMRRPRLHELFGRTDPGLGLSSVLSEKDVKLSQVIRRSRIPGLYYLTSGPVPKDPLALLRSRRFRQVLGTAAVYFNNIVIDSPPVLSVPDYMPLCDAVKRVVMIVRQGQTLQEEVRKSVALMRNIPGATIVGVVLNRTALSPGRYSSSGDYRSPYRYSYYERSYCRGS